MRNGGRGRPLNSVVSQHAKRHRVIEEPVDDFPWFAIIFGVVVAVWIYKLVAHGGLRGAMFGARVKATVGEIDLNAGGFIKQKLLIYRLESGSDADIGLELRATTLASYQMQPVPLTKAQARTLSQLLAKAAE
jgi:hypothetical protein